MLARTHLADRTLDWSPLNRPPAVVSRADGIIEWPKDLRRVLIYGAGYGHEQAPLDDPTWMVWALNLIPPQDRLGRVRADVWWDIHQRAAQTEADLRWIAQCPVPIFVPDDLLDAGPTCVRLPIERLEARFGVSYWTCTFCYQIALALALGVREIGLFGVDLAFGTPRERTVEWAGTSWWMGYGAALGVRFVTPAGGRMARHRRRYGLEYADEAEDVDGYLEDMQETALSDKPSVGG